MHQQEIPPARADVHIQRRVPQIFHKLREGIRKIPLQRLQGQDGRIRAVAQPPEQMLHLFQLQAADAMRDAAKNEGGGAGLTAGIGAGMGIGNYMSQAFGMNQQQPAQQAAPAAAAPAAAETPSVLTPSEVAQMLKVAEEDIIAAINAGDLKARKIGSAYRISKDAVDEFLKG